MYFRQKALLYNFQFNHFILLITSSIIGSNGAYASGKRANDFEFMFLLI